MFGFFKNKAGGPVQVEEQLRVLAKGGVLLDAHVPLQTLFDLFSREEFENDPYKLLLCVLGEEAEEEAKAGESGYLSDNIWHFDSECIEDHGAYADIAWRMSTLAQGALPLEQIEDLVDIENGVAWLSFHLNGQAYRWTALVNDDWVDDGILSQMAALLESRKSGQRFTHIALDGQDCLIGCATAAQKAWLEAKTGLKIEWLK